jgi:hypothetical protein
MAYMRGDYYIWRGSCYAAEGLDDPPDSRECIYFSTPDMSGSMDMDVFDDLVVMRYAQIVEQGRMREVKERAAQNYEGNFGCDALRKSMKLRTYGTKEAIQELVAKVKNTGEQEAPQQP